MSLSEALTVAKKSLAPVQSKYRIIYEDQREPDSPIKIVTPDPNWLAAALHGGFLPPVHVYLQMVHDGDGNLINPELFHTFTPIGAMTEEQALEYLLLKDVPQHVWGEPSNRPRYKIINKDALPASREFRNEFKLETPL